MKLAEVYECPTCGYRLEAPIPYLAAWCPKSHEGKRKIAMKLIWDAASGNEIPKRKVNA